MELERLPYIETIRKGATTSTTSARRDYASLSALIDDAVGGYRDPESTGDVRRASEDTDGMVECQTDSYAEAVTLAREGWPEGRALIETLVDRIKEHVDTRIGMLQRPVIMPAVAGPMVNVPAYIAGMPDAMFAWDSEDAPGAVVQVVCNVGALGGVSGAAMQMRGAAVVALVDILESTGRRCEVTAVSRATSTGRAKHTMALEFRALLKSAESPLQMDSLAFACTHPSMLRRLVFSLRENMPANYRKAFNCAEFGSGMGGSVNVERDEQGDIYAPALDHTTQQVWHSEQAAEEWVIAQLREQGVIE